MPVETGDRLRRADAYVRYDFEDVAFRWDHISRKVYRKFFGAAREAEVEMSNRLFSDALRYGEEITRHEYNTL